MGVRLVPGGPIEDDDDSPEMSGNVLKDAAATALAHGQTQAAAAELAEVDERTIRRWYAEPEFAATIRTIRAAALSAAVGVLTVGAQQAAVQMVRLAVDPHPSGAVRLNACKSILALGHEFVTVADLEARLTAVEARLS